MASSVFTADNGNDIPGMLDRLIQQTGVTGNMSAVIRVIRGMHGQIDALKETLHANSHDPQRLSEQNEMQHNAVFLAALYQEAQQIAEQVHTQLLHQKKRLRAQKSAHLAKLAKLFALYSAYLAIDYQRQKEADEKFQDYLKKAAENTHMPVVAKAMHAMAELIAHVMAMSEPREKAVQIVATTFVVTETVNNAIKMLSHSDDAEVRAFAEGLEQQDGQGRVALIRLVTEDVLTRNEREEKLRRLMQQARELGTEEAAPVVLPPAPDLRPSPLELPRMDMLFEIQLMGLLRELQPALYAQDLKNRLKVQSRLLEAMHTARPSEGLFTQMEQNIASVGQQLLARLDANDILQNQLVPPVVMPSFNRNKAMTAAMRPSPRPVLIPTNNTGKKQDELEEDLSGRKTRLRS